MAAVAGAQAAGAPPAVLPHPPARRRSAQRPRQACIRAAASSPEQQQQPQQHAAEQGTSTSRAQLLRRLALLSAAAAAAPGSGLSLHAAPSAAAAAAAPATLPPLQPAAVSLTRGPRSVLALADVQLLPLPPGPVAFPRRQLELNFAVLQLRSGYEAVDDLDFVPMNEYQKAFWKLRQAEWQPYTLLNSPLTITQGNLADPLYFDFITFSQAAAAAATMRAPQQVFEEYSEESEAMGVVRRDPALADDALLPARWYEREGDRLYYGLLEGFRGVQYGAPPPCAPGAPDAELLAGVQRLCDIYVERGYALKATLVPGGRGGAAPAFEVKLEGPANLWSLQALAARRSSIYNDHAAAAIAAFLRASGRSSSCRLSWSDTGVSQQWTLQA